MIPKQIYGFSPSWPFVYVEIRDRHPKSRVPRLARGMIASGTLSGYNIWCHLKLIIRFVPLKKKKTTPQRYCFEEVSWLYQQQDIGNWSFHLFEDSYISSAFGSWVNLYKWITFLTTESCFSFTVKWHKTFAAWGCKWQNTDVLLNN